MPPRTTVHRESVDRSAHSSGPLQSWDPRLKVGLTGAMLVAISFGARTADIESWLRLVFLTLVALVTAGIGGISHRRWFGRSLVVLPFALFVAVAALVAVVPGHTEGVPLGGWTLTAAPGGVEKALRLLARAWVSILVTLLLAMTTPLSSILTALERWHFPRGFLEVCSLVYRYLWVLLEEGRRLLLARRLRGGTAPPWRSGGRILATLFARALGRAQRIEIALRLRGYRGTLPLGRRLAWTGRDSRRLLLATVVLTAAVIAPHWKGWVG